MEQNDWQKQYSNSQHRQRMPDTPPHQNMRRYSQQPMQAPLQQSPLQSQQQLPQGTTASQYPYATSTHTTASPSSRQSITSDVSGINIRDDTLGGAVIEKSARPNLSVVPSGLRPGQPQQSNHQGVVPSSPPRQTTSYNATNYSVNPPHPGISRTTSDEMRHYVQPSSNSRHSSPMHTVSPSMSPYYPTTPHMLNSINEREQTMSWSQAPAQARQSPSRPAYAFPPPGRDSISPRSHLHIQSSPNTQRHSMPHVPSGYDAKAQFSPRQTTHFTTNAITSSPNISPTSFSPRQASFAMNRDPGSMMSDIVYSSPPPAKFRIVASSSKLSSSVNAQPKYRRANPDGGFISPLQALTMHLPTTYRLCNDKFTYESSRNPRRCLTKPGKGLKNDGFDNEDSDYILYVNDVLGLDQGHKYLILDILGQGTFAQVVKCQNMKTMEVVAVKVVKNKPAYFNQGRMEVSILEILNNEVDPNDEHHILRLRDNFIQKGHLCLVFELLSVNLYELIKQNQYRGLGLNLVRVFAGQLLDAMCQLKEARIIHCDLKPENILLTAEESPTIKVVDFGSACHERHTVFTYIQSRFYRSPEVMLGLPYSTAIDMWSVGCIAVELFLGLPLFPGSSEYNQITRIVEMFGMPPGWMIDVGKQAGEFFETRRDSETGQRKTYRLKSIEQYSREHNTQEQPSKKYFKGTLLPEIVLAYDRDKGSSSSSKAENQANERKSRTSFIDFVSGLLRINPLERWTPQQAKNHPFILDTEWTGPFNPLADNRYAGPPPSPSRAKAQPAQHTSSADSSRRASKHQSTYEQPQRYDPPKTYDTVAPAPPPQAYYSPRHAQVQPPHHQPTQYLAQNQPHYISQQPGHTAFTHAPQMLSAYPPSQEWDPHSRQARVRDNRPRANTIGIDTIPLQLRQATARIDPAHQIRPSPAYYPPHDIEGILTEDGLENSTSRNMYAMQGGYGGGVEGGMRPRKKSQGNAQMAGYHTTQVTTRGQQPQGQGQMLVPPQQNLFRGSARALEDGLMPPWQ